MSVSFAVKASSNEGGSFELPEAGTYGAVLVALVDLGTHESNFTDADGTRKRQRKIHLVWELTSEFDSKGEPFLVCQSYTWNPKSLNSKAALRKVVEGYLGRTLSENEPVDYADFLGKPCSLGVSVGTTAGGKRFAEVASISKPMRGLAIAPASHGPFAFRVDGLNSTKDPLDIPDWIPPTFGRKVEDEIRTSDEYGRLSPF